MRPEAAVTLVSAIRLQPGTESAHRVLQDRAVQRARRLGGLLRAELVPAIEGVQPETVALMTFADHAALDRWLRSEERRRVLAEMAELDHGDRTVTVISDFAGWFSRDGGPSPRRWKQAAVVMAALVPVSLLMAALREAIAPGLPLVPAVAISSVANVAVLTWIVMPALTEALRGWLSK